MSFHKEDGVSSLCQKALHIVTELCFAGQVEWEKCSGIFPPDRGSQGGGSTGNPWRAPLASPRPARTPRAPLPASVSGASRRWGHLWNAAPSYLDPFPTHQLATLSAGCPGFVSCPPIRLLPLLWSAPCPPAASGSLAPAPPRRALPRLASPYHSGTVSAGDGAGTACPALLAGSALLRDSGWPGPSRGSRIAGLGKGPGGTACAWMQRTALQMGLRWPPKAAKIPERVTRVCDLLSS